MRRFLAIVLFSFAMVVGAHAAGDDDVQQGIFDTYLKLAIQGDVVAQYVVAQSYENGRGTEKNMDKAMYWYEMAAKHEYPLAIARVEQYKSDQAKKNPVPVEKPREESKALKPATVETRNKREPVKKPVEARKEHREEANARRKMKSAKAAETLRREEILRHEKLVREKTSKPARPAVVPVVAKPVETKPEVVLPPPVVVAKAPTAVERPLPTINVMDALLSGKWQRNQQDAEFLPSAHVACLQSGNTDVVCFSQEFTRNVGNDGLTYNVKSVISGINNKESRFNLRYIYNVADIADKPFAQPSGMSTEINDIAVKKGWQEPGVSMDCHMHDERSLTCTRVDRKMAYQFVRE